MFYAVDFKDGKIGVWDDMDDTVEYWTPSALKNVIKKLGLEIYGVTIEENVNPIYTLDGLTVNLFYRHSTRVDRFRVVLLNTGEYWGRTFSSRVDKPTVAFFDTSTSFSKQKYPSGQYVASYYAETILGHKGGLILDTDVPDWKVNGDDIREIQIWLKYQLGIK